MQRGLNPIITHMADTQLLGDSGLCITLIEHKGDEDTIREENLFKLGLGYDKISLNHMLNSFHIRCV